MLQWYRLVDCLWFLFYSLPSFFNTWLLVFFMLLWKCKIGYIKKIQVWAIEWQCCFFMTGRSIHIKPLCALILCYSVCIAEESLVSFQGGKCLVSCLHQVSLSRDWEMAMIPAVLQRSWFYVKEKEKVMAYEYPLQL